MANTVRNVALVLVLAVGAGWLSGCALMSAGKAEPPTGPTEMPATSVELVRSGGEAGVSDTWRVTAGAPPPAGMSAAEAREVLRIAGSEQFRAISPPLVVPSGYCCDRFHYGVTVAYADGSTAHHETADGLDSPEAMAQLITTLN